MRHIELSTIRHYRKQKAPLRGAIIVKEYNLCEIRIMSDAKNQDMQRTRLKNHIFL